MADKQAETAYEKKRLETTIAVATEQLQQAKKSIETRQAEMVDMKKHAREKYEFSMADLSDPEAFDAFVELSQFDSLLTKMSTDHDEDLQKIKRLESLIKNPYFARIDFIFAGEDTPEQIYIGRSPLSEKASRQIYVYDWRSPIASVFYRFMTGKAFYDAPNGRILGEVTKKRQYEIKNSVLQYYFDTDMNINDEILRQILSQNASPKMKAIVETIQREQDVVIRDMENDLLMVQGVAGSGKTSIALHRTAYLMYQGLQARLSAGNILILSPNSAFEDYISGVLPELGEKNVNTATFDEILRNILGAQKIQSHANFLDSLFSRNRYCPLIKSCIHFKTSDSFLKILDCFIEDIPLRFLSFRDLKYHEKRVVTEEELKRYLLRNPQIPLGTRIKNLESFVYERLFGTGHPKGDREEQFQISQTLRNITVIDIPALYLKLFQTDSYFDSLNTDTDSFNSLRDIRRFTTENLTAGLLQFDDALAMGYLTLKIYGTDNYRNIKQVVIDEAQDYYPIQYEMFRLLFPRAKFTILGDVNQTLAKSETMSFYDDIAARLGRPRASLVILDKSFRCTNEILNFSLRFVPEGQEIKSFNRSGNAPQTAIFNSRQELLQGILTEIQCAKNDSLNSICLLCKTAAACENLYDDLKALTDISLIRDNGSEDLQGCFLMPVYLSKGLEFDAVIVCDASLGNYSTEDDKKLLYVECTRALHRLAVFGEEA